MSNAQGLDDRAQRRQRISKLDQHKSKIISKIADTPIATAESVLNNCPFEPSPVLLGAIARSLSHALSKLAGYRHQRTRYLKYLLSELHKIAPHKTYPIAPLPDKHFGEEVEELIEQALSMMPHLKPREAYELSQRCLKLIHKAYDGIPPHLAQTAQVLRYRPPAFPPIPGEPINLQLVEPEGHA